MSETPQERVSRWLNDPLVDLADTEIREAIQAVLDLVRVQYAANEEMTRLLAQAEAALRKLTVDEPLQGRAFKGNEELPGTGEFYRAYNAGIKTQFEYARSIAHAVLRDTKP